MSYSIPSSINRILVTGGAGFIGGALIRRLLKETNAVIYNLDKLSYSSDTSSIDQVISSFNSLNQQRYQLLRCDLYDQSETNLAIDLSDPDLVIHLASETHVDRSIDNPFEFVKSNIVGTYNLLEAVRKHWLRLSDARRENFRLHHISTDEVFGSLGKEGSFSEGTAYYPKSPYSASKASSDHLINAWFHTYSIPVVTTNCSNNYGPWQFPEKLIPLVINKGINDESIPIYGNGLNVRDWLYVEDHIDAILLVATKGDIGKRYCIGGFGEMTNKQIVDSICVLLDEYIPKKKSHKDLIEFVKDRPGHDFRYSINSELIQKELGWYPKHCFKDGLEFTVKWYIDNKEWSEKVCKKSNYNIQRLGTSI